MLKMDCQIAENVSEFDGFQLGHNLSVYHFIRLYYTAANLSFTLCLCPL